jgi:site-specific DNA recombinase
MLQEKGCPDLLDRWVQRAHHRTRRHQSRGDDTQTRVRFAFYGRTSTRHHQHQATSAAWQRDAAETTIAGHGVIVAEYFDTGCSRRLPWTRRPRAAALLAALANDNRGFDAIVVGEYERAFTDNQFTRLLPLLEHHDVQVWLPEAGGRFNAANPAHQALMTMLGAQSHREVLRARHRALAAMCAQARDQGRYLGGRPPYGYRLADAGPHPNRTHAHWGRRAQQLEPDPATAPHVQWMFAQRLQGASLASIARTLNDQGIPCPSELDPHRKPPQAIQTWRVPTVASILANPRYTGRQVWNRQSAHRASNDQDIPLMHQWNTPQQWVISHKASHHALVSEPDFVAAQAIRAQRPTDNGNTRTYLLAGLLRCGLCHRRMDSHWVNQRPSYRCRHGHTSTRKRSPNQPKNLYIREDRILAQLTAHLTNPNPDGNRASHHSNDPSEQIVQFLRERNLVLVCNTKGWIIDTDPA